ncbi:MAG TPA: toll/interleukin-1 receptor domain-containing protein [Longimicrobiaceae bacterium]|nr:toll/interleukin-1 receptor domain-containing protein [Longimicrobiaceae bacterium]
MPDPSLYKPVAFMSYVHSDDEHENGRLTQFRQRLSGELRIQTGESFDIFQDRKDIAWGQQWKRRIEESIDTATFLIPVVTPAFFRSPACRAELERFLKREQKLGRSDLILPLYYVECAALTDEAQRERDPLAQAIADRQYTDWRELRFESFTSPEVGRRLASIARQIVLALARAGPARETQPKPKWTAERFLEDARGRLRPRQFAAVNALLAWSKRHATEVAWGSGKERGSFSVRFAEVSPSKSVFSVYSDGTLTVNVGWLTESEAALACARSLAACVHTHRITEIPKHFEQRFPTVRIDEWEDALGAFTDCVTVAVEAARQVTAH